MTTHDARVQQQFDPQAEAYVTSVVHAEGPDLNWLRQWAGTLGPDRRALDVGCGGGHLAFALADAGCDVTATDPLPRMLQATLAEAGRRGLRKVAIMQATAVRLPFPDGAFDVVATRYSAHHWRDLPAALTEMRRVTRPGGSVVVIDLLGEDSPLVDTHLQAMELLRDPSHVRDRARTEWRALLAAAALELVEEQVWPVRIDYGAWIARMRTPPEAQAAIALLVARMPEEARVGLRLETDGSFTAWTGAFRAIRTGSHRASR